MDGYDLADLGGVEWVSKFCPVKGSIPRALMATMWRREDTISARGHDQGAMLMEELTAAPLICRSASAGEVSGGDTSVLGTMCCIWDGGVGGCCSQLLDARSC